MHTRSPCHERMGGAQGGRRERLLRNGHPQPQPCLVFGRRVDLLRTAGAGSDMDIYRIRPTGGTPERMTEQHTFMNSLAPLDARTQRVARQDDGTGPWLWPLDVPSKVTRRVTLESSNTRPRPVATAGAWWRLSPAPSQTLVVPLRLDGRPTNTLWRIRWGPRGDCAALQPRVVVLSIHQWIR